MSKRKDELEEFEEDYDQYDEEVEDEELEDDEEDVEDKPSKKGKKQKQAKPKSTVSPAFKECIKNYLDSFAAVDEPFKKKYANPEKNLEDCCNYIFNQVKKSGCMGFADDEIYQMARHYYQEEIKADELKAVSGQVVVNHKIELTEEDKKKAYEKALEEYKAKCLKEQENKAKKEAEAENKKAEIEKKKVEKAEAERKAKLEEAKNKGAGLQTSIFDLL